MSTKTILADLPGIYSRLLPEFFKNEIPNESFATCHNCAMVSKTPGKQLKLKPYLPDIMCCSYYPGLPNYLIGGILHDTDPALDEGRRRLREIIENKTGVSPIGIQPPVKYSLFFTRTGDAFGQSKLMLCPYFNREKRNCTIWKYREATCSTYFCKFAGADVGQKFWISLKRYLNFIQQQLCNYVLLEKKFRNLDEIITGFNFGPKNVERMSLRDLEEKPPTDEEYKQNWQDWTGREEEFYKSAFTLIDGLSTEKFNEINGVTGQITLEKLERDWSIMMDVPATLIKNPALQFREAGEDNYIVHLERIDTIFHVPKVLLDSFNGCATSREVRESIKKTFEIEIDDEFILKLYHYGILVEKQ